LLRLCIARPAGTVREASQFVREKTDGPRQSLTVEPIRRGGGRRAVTIDEIGDAAQWIAVVASPGAFTPDARDSVGIDDELCGRAATGE